MKTPKAEDLARQESKSLAKEQGGTSYEGTNMSPQAKAEPPAEGSRSGND